MSHYEAFDWNDWFDDDALETERLDADMYLQELEDEAARQDAADKAAALLMVELAPDLEDYGGTLDGFGHVISDADPGL